MALELKNRVKETVQVEFPMGLFFEKPTAAALAQFLLEKAPGAAPTPDPIAEDTARMLLDQIEHLPEEEVDSLLREMMK